jgi:hypothetical protein
MTPFRQPNKAGVIKERDAMGDKHKGHKKHLCAVFAGGDGIDEVAALAVGARFICKSCGRSAIKKKYLCKPKKLPGVDGPEAG